MTIAGYLCDQTVGAFGMFSFVVGSPSEIQKAVFPVVLVPFTSPEDLHKGDFNSGITVVSQNQAGTFGKGHGIKIIIVSVCIHTGQQILYTVVSQLIGEEASKRRIKIGSAVSIPVCTERQVMQMLW